MKDEQATREEPQQIEREIASIREELDDLVGELDRRRHAAFDWRLQIQRHQRGLAVGAVAVIALVAVRRRVRSRRPLGPSSPLAEALVLAALRQGALGLARGAVRRLGPGRTRRSARLDTA